MYMYIYKNSMYNLHIHISVYCVFTYRSRSSGRSSIGKTQNANKKLTSENKVKAGIVVVTVISHNRITTSHDNSNEARMVPLPTSRT